MHSTFLPASQRAAWEVQWGCPLPLPDRSCCSLCPDLLLLPEPASLPRSLGPPAGGPAPPVRSHAFFPAEPAVHPSVLPSYTHWPLVLLVLTPGYIANTSLLVPTAAPPLVRTTHLSRKLQQQHPYFSLSALSCSSLLSHTTRMICVKDQTSALSPSELTADLLSILSTPARSSEWPLPTSPAPPEPVSFLTDPRPALRACRARSHHGVFALQLLLPELLSPWLSTWHPLPVVRASLSPAGLRV